MNKQVIKIESHDKFKGIRGPLNQEGGIIKKKESQELLDQLNSIFSENSLSKEGVNAMDVTQKEYIDQRIGSLEKSIDHRFDSTEKLLSEKMDHLAARLEGAISNQNTKLDGKIELLKSNLDHSIDTKLTTFKEEMAKDQKESKRHTTTVTLTTVGIATAIIIGILGFVI